MRSKEKSKELFLAAQQQNTQKHYQGSKLISVVEQLVFYIHGFNIIGAPTF
jgi:hypothetical protein